MNQAHDQKITHFFNLHQRATPLLLPNAWDAASARLFESVGAESIATSSASLAWSLGYADGGALPANELIAAVKRIARVINVPLTIDIEDGYSTLPQQVSELVRLLASEGIVGINIEDGVQPVELLAEKITAICDAQARSNFRVFINARTDVYLRQLAQGEAAIAMTNERARLYSRAGADGLFIPGLTDPVAVSQIARETSLPINLMMLPKMPAIEQLATAGVRRISVGPAPFQLAYGCTLKAVEQFIQNSDTESMFAHTAALPRMNELLN